MNAYLNSLLLAATNGEAAASASSASANLEYFLAAYLLLWTVIFAYLVYLHRYIGRLEEKIETDHTERGMNGGERTGQAGPPDQGERG